MYFHVFFFSEVWSKLVFGLKLNLGPNLGTMNPYVIQKELFNAKITHSKSHGFTYH